jgi:phosphoribosylformimino-5-aminoimidazole carboxamide ribotide isomerase
MDGFVTQQGWTASIPVRSVDFVADMAKAGVKLIIFTDINRDGMLKGPNIKALKAVLEASHVPVIASGGVSNIEDIQALKCLEDLGLAGAIVGKALYEGKLDLKEALAVC